MKRLYVLTLSLLFTVSLFGCSEEGDDPPSAKHLSTTAHDKMFDRPNEYADYRATFQTVVFDVERTDKQLIARAWADPESNRHVIRLFIDDVEADIAPDDYIKVEGRLMKPKKKGDSLIPQLHVEQWEKMSYFDAVSPIHDSIAVEQTLEQFGVTVQLQTLESSDSFHYVTLALRNDSATNVLIAPSNMTMTFDGAQTVSPLVENEIDDPLSEELLAPHEARTGTVLFPVSETSPTTIELNVFASSDDYDVSFEPFTFSIDE